MNDTSYHHILEIAKTTHEVNRAYCAGLGDLSHLPWDKAPQWQRDSAIDGVNKIWKGEAKSPKEQHESWMAKKEQEGWIYGTIKDPEAKTHPCLVPYEDLPVEQRAKDHLFRTVVLGMMGKALDPARELSLPPHGAHWVGDPTIPGAGTLVGGDGTVYGVDHTGALFVSRDIDDTTFLAVNHVLAVLAIAGLLPGGSKEI